MQFLYPSIRQFPFDSTCEQIVLELEKRNWQVPGVSVKFNEYGSEVERFRMVSRIGNQDFKLWFCRTQKTIANSQWNDIAAVAEITIPQKKLRVFEDESGPFFDLYVGNGYERDREQFMNGSKANIKIKGEPKMCLKYQGGCDCRTTVRNILEGIRFLPSRFTGDAKKLTWAIHTHHGRRSPLLMPANDFENEYDFGDNGLKIFRTAEVMEEFKQYLEDVVLDMIVSHPISMKKVDTLVSSEPIPFPEFVGLLFCFGKYREAERIKQGKIDPYKLDLTDRFGLSSDGYRLMPLEVSNDGTVPEIAYGKFLWCGVGKVTDTTAIESLDVPGHYRWSDSERFVICVKPNLANEIYIADHGQYDKRREELADSLKSRDRFTDAEVNDFTCARARTVIPISEYQGEYENPVVLINRKLSFDEVEIVSGPHKGRLDR